MTERLKRSQVCLVASRHSKVTLKLVRKITRCRALKVVADSTTTTTTNTLFHPMVITIFIQINIQVHVDGVLANIKVKNARQPVRRKDI